MGELAVTTHGQDLNPKFFQLIMIGGNCRQFGGSDEGEITRVEAEGNPLPSIIGQLDILESATYKCAGLKVSSCEIFEFISGSLFVIGPPAGLTQPSGSLLISTPPGVWITLGSALDFASRSSSRSRCMYWLA